MNRPRGVGEDAAATLAFIAAAPRAVPAQAAILIDASEARGQTILSLEGPPDPAGLTPTTGGNVNEVGAPAVGAILLADPDQGMDTCAVPTTGDTIELTIPDPDAVVPLPATAPLLIRALGLSGLLRRRGRNRPRRDCSSAPA